jgi:glutamyl-tRNA synthetase
VRLGWSHGDQEVFTRDEMIAAFDIKDVNQAASAFNPDKLLWLNQQHMMRAPVAALAAGMRSQLALLGVTVDDNRLLEGVANAQRERARTLKEMAQNSIFFFRDIESYDEKAARKNLTADAMPGLQALLEGFKALGEWNAGSIHEVINAVAQRYGVGLGKVAQPLRVAICGGAISPPIDITVALLGRETTCARIERALRWTASV